METSLDKVMDEMCAFAILNCGEVKKHIFTSKLQQLVLVRNLKLADFRMAQPGVYGCLFADNQGLGLAAKGKASVNSAGVISAIASLAAKLEPESGNPIITYENDSRVCILKKNESLTGAIFKFSDSMKN